MGSEEPRWITIQIEMRVVVLLVPQANWGRGQSQVALGLCGTSQDGVVPLLRPKAVPLLP